MNSKIVLLSIFISFLLHGLILLGPFGNTKSIVKSVFSSKKSGFKVSFNEVREKKKKVKKILKKHKKKTHTIKKRINKQVLASDSAVINSKILKKTIPKYPYKSRKYHEEGVVLLVVNISAKGKALNSVVLKSSGFERLDQSAVTAAMNSEYEGASKGGVLTESKLELEFKFELNN